MSRKAKILVVDDDPPNRSGSSNVNGSSGDRGSTEHNRVENGPSSAGARPSSNLSSSSRSTPRQKDGEKPGTPGAAGGNNSKPSTPNGQIQNGKPPTPGAAFPPGFPRPPGPGEIPMGYPYQNGAAAALGVLPRPPFVSDIRSYRICINFVNFYYYFSLQE